MVGQAAMAIIRGPLTPREVSKIEQGLRYYGRQAQRWELIARDFMPYRSPVHLCRLWAAHVKLQEAVTSAGGGSAAAGGA